MALTVVDDLTVLADADSTTGWFAVAPDVLDGILVNTLLKAEGSGSIRTIFQETGVGGQAWQNASGVDHIRRHIGIWINPAAFSVTVSGGVRIRLSSSTGTGAANTEDWFLAGQNTVIGAAHNGWQRYFLDVLRPSDASSGNLVRTSIRQFGGLINLTGGAADQSELYVDQLVHGTGITVTGGASAPRGSAEIAAADITASRGFFKTMAGSFYIVGRVTIGDVTAATNSTFEDANEVWIMEGATVSAAFNRIEFVGGSGTNRATFGSSSGSGVDKEASGGNTFVAGGDNPFRIEAIDSDITTELFGCSLTNAPALNDDVVRSFQREDDSGASFDTEDAYDVNDDDANDAAVFVASSAINDNSYFGHDERFSLIKADTGTAGVGTYTVTWEYSTSGGWSALTDLTDGTSNFKTTGEQTVSYSIPDDWVKRTVNSVSMYWIRARRDGGTMTTAPLLDRVKLSLGGGIRWEHANAEAIRCTFTNMDTIRVRNGAFIKKCIITDSVAPAKSAALDLGSADPTADTVRDLTIQNCSKGILLKGSGDTTYNFRNIKFANNTNDVRVDFGGSDTITINILEGGDTPTIDNVNSSTVVIVNAVTLLVTVKDQAGANVQNARVAIFRDDNDVQLMNELTLADGTATETFAFVSDTAVSVRVRRGSTGATKFIPINSPQTITSDGLTVTITLTEDANNAT